MALAVNREQKLQNPHFSEASAEGVPLDWGVWEPDWRPAACVVRSTPEGLRVSGADAYAVGGVMQDVAGLRPGQAYAIRSRMFLEGIAQPLQVVRIRFQWLQGDKPDHPAGILVSGPVRTNEEWTFDDVLVAPDGIDGARITLEVRWPRGGSVLCRGISLTPAEVPAARTARIGTVYLRPADTTPERNVELFCEQVDAAGKENVDILCLPEMLTFIGTWKTYPDSAQEIPGVYTDRLGEAAKRNRMWLVAGLVEKERERLYNTAVLFNRKGEIAGTYRKVHIPFGEWHNGIAPGETYPVFDTDFGRIGIQICYDGFFGENTRALALAGAEVVFAPTWGTTFEDTEDGRVEGKNIFRVRARDNGVYIVPCVYDGCSMVIDPQGRVVASSGGNSGVFWADADLANRERLPWVGQWGSICPRDRMPHTYGPLLEPTPSKAVEP